MCRCVDQINRNVPEREFSPGRIAWWTLLTLVLFALLVANAPGGDPVEHDGRHWSYRPISRPAVPQVAQTELVRSPIDAFLLAELNRRSLSFSPPAGRAEILRRLKFDLLGLPPAPTEIDEFVADASPDAYERLVDRFLESPQYGERWGRLWLDVVRYADTAGFNADPVRPLAYKYRDYVIRAFNDDLPYDQFLREQLAGDELYPDRAEAIVATGFLRLPPDESNASNVELARQELLNDLTANVGNIFLAQSLGCAQCHDHKFDEIAQEDFYRLQAFFSGLIWVDRHPVGTPEQLADYERRTSEWLAGTSALRHELLQLELPVRIRVTKERRMKFPRIVLESLDALPEERTALQHQLAFFAERQIELKEPELLKAFSKEQKARRDELQAELARREQERPKPPREVLSAVAIDGLDTPRTFLLRGGSYNKPAEELTPGFPPAFDSSESPPQISPPRTGAIGRRTALANWLSDPRHPLVARVVVNRIWQGHFGVGLVENANDFGVQTPPPSHPELLDWLAAEFVNPTADAGRPWTWKRLHRLIVLSNAYRQGSRRSPQADLAGFAYQFYPRRRLEAEVLRDSLLSVSGLLDPRMYGPGVQPELPPGYTAREAWTVSSDRGDRCRRSLYILAKRNLPYPLLQSFDFPDMHESCARRAVTTTAPQALLMLNSELVLDYSRAFAGRLLSGHPAAEPEPLVRDAWKLALGRDPADAELSRAVRFLAESVDAHRNASPRDLPRPFPKFLDPARAAAVVDLCHALFNTNEFVYVD